MKKSFLISIGLIVILACQAQTYNFDEGMKAMKEKDYEKAMDYLSRDLKDNPKSGTTYFYRAAIYQYNEQYSMALSDINNAIKFVAAKDKNLLGASYLVRAKIYSIIDENEKALNDFGYAIKLNPENLTGYMERASYYHDMGQFDKAESDYRKALALDEGDIKTWTSLGRNYLAQKKYAEAEKTLNQAIKLDPEYIGGYYYRGLTYYEQNKADEAIDDIFKCLLIDEKDSDIRSMYVDYAAKNYPLALSKVSRQITLHPENEMWFFIRGKIFEAKYDLTAAIADYTKVIELASVDFKATLLANRARCYSNAGLYQKAIKDYTESLELDSTDSYNLGYRANTKRLMGDYKGAIEDFSKAAVMEPREAWFLYSRGWSKEFVQDYQGALSDYNDAISINKTMAYYFLNRGRLYEKHLNNKAKAAQDYEKILLLDTIVKDESNCRQYALFHLGREEESIAWLKKILDQYSNEGNYYDATCLYSLMNKPTEAIASLTEAFEKGYRDFTHISVDDDLDNIRNLKEFNDLVESWKKVHQATLSTEPSSKENEQPVNNDLKTYSIPLKSKGSGIYEIPCRINELPLNMILDTGASDISISQTEVNFMLKNGYLQAEDITGTNRYKDANGDIGIGTKILLRKVDFGGLVLKNIDAMVVQNKTAPILFGQSALGKYGKIIIDNEKMMMTITGKRN